MQVMNYGCFEIRPALRQVWVRGSPSPLGARAFDVLMLLATRSDHVLSKHEIIEAVWPDVVIEENNLSVQISALRRVLGADAITTVTGRGYQFTARAVAGESVPAATASHVAGNVPETDTRLFGREAELAQLLGAFPETACVSVCGLAGVGKTALATAAARQLAARRDHASGVWLVDLTGVRDGAQLAQAVCEVVGIALDGRLDPVIECLSHLKRHEILLVLDNCEHIVEVVADFVERLLSGAGRARVLATSQEPLHVRGERIVRLEPLAVPSPGDAADADAYGSVRMLLGRVRNALGAHFEPSPDERVDLIEICRQLDGIPLALEFAASRVPLLGLSGVRHRLHDRLLLAGGARTASPRHRSLQAALEWSHQLLAPTTRAVLHQLAVFPGGFSLLGAQWLLGAASEDEFMEHLNVLIDRSLVTLDAGPRPRYRLLQTTRAFALEHLRAQADPTDWDARLASTMRRVCLRAARDRDTPWMWQEMTNARTALDWAIEAPGQGETAVTIATYISVVLGAGGAIREAMNHLLRVQPLLDDRCGTALVARYWHWLGRLGVEGRRPTSQCVEALKRADALFDSLGEQRHRHACQRHLAEAQLRAGQIELADGHLRTARQLEGSAAVPADRMRRLRVEALLADARGDHATALRHAQAALALAEAHRVDRYRLLLIADMAWSHLQMGQSDAAATAFGELLLHLDHGIRQGLARARAWSGLTAALVAAGRTGEAARSAARSVRVLQEANLLPSRCDVFAWVCAASGDLRTAARLIGTAGEFSARTETERDPISRLAHERAMELIHGGLSEDDLSYWREQGAMATEEELVHLLQQAFVVATVPAQAARSRDAG